jgi:hypothetical protein
MHFRSVIAALAVASFTCLPACEEEKKEGPDDEAKAKAAAVASAQAALEAAQKAAADRADEAKKPSGPPVLKVTDLELTDERRGKIEEGVPDAKGFLAATDIEADIHKAKLDDEAKAVKAWDAKTKGKWILIKGNIANITENDFDLAVTYTPQAPNDPMGMSKKFFFVKLSGVEGYEMKNYKDGQFAVMLMKYDGQKKASAGHDVVAEGYWM